MDINCQHAKKQNKTIWQYVSGFRSGLANLCAGVTFLATESKNRQVTQATPTQPDPVLEL